MIHFSKLRTKGAFLLPLSVALSLSLANADELNQSSASPTSTSAESTDSKVENMDKVKLNRSVVTASGYEQDIKEASASISVIDKEEILTRPIRDIGDAVQDVPGVFVEATKTGGNQIYMRGMDPSYTLMLIDGKRQNVNSSFDANGFNGAHSGFMPPLSMIEKIEVIRGPASVVHGSDAMGGVINIITKKNPDRFTGNIMLETRLQEQSKNWGNTYGANGYIAAPIIKDKLSFNVRGAYSTTAANYFYKPDGLSSCSNRGGVTSCGPADYTNPYTTHSPAGYTQWNAGARLNFTPNSQNNIYLDGEYYYQHSGSLNTSGNQITALNEFNKTNLVLNHDGNYSFGNLTSYIQYMQTIRLPQTAAIGANSGVSNPSSKRDNKNIILSSTYNNSFDLGGAGEIVASGGIYYMYESLLVRGSNTSTDRNRQVSGESVLPNSTREQNQFAVYAEGQYFINEYVNTTLGARYNYSDIYKGMPNPRFYVNVNPFSWWTIKMGVASGMKIPALWQLYDGYYGWTTSNNAHVDQYGNQSLQAEKSWNYELSFIFDTAPAYIILTGFYTDFIDKVETNYFDAGAVLPGGYGACGAYGGAQCAIYNNIDKSITTGFELSLKTKAYEGFSFDASYAFTHTKKLTGANQGDHINNIPRHNVVGKLNYRYNNFDAYLRASGKFKTPTPSSANRGATQTVRQALGQYYKDYVLLDLAANYRFKKAGITLSFAINNLLNTNFVDYVLYNPVSHNGQEYLTSYTNQYQRLLPGRNYWISLKYDF